ncbi:MAG: MDR/zinc-dependent alcohol dehydrogenase-like family protein [Roseiflexaceae bacterium]|jgi:alcohol dehydrogenase|nr:alcohol dehydrogenase catalytic domain-containing protein [Chloroflexaceae bacterium]
MRAVVFDGTLRLERNRPDAVAPANEALIQVHLAGICNTDIEITRGYKGFNGILGHEFVGTVVACADATWLGKRVVGEINAACRTCPTCLRGDDPHCPNRTTLGIFNRPGSMADLVSIPIDCLHEVPADVSDRQAVFVEPLAAALEILQQTHLRPTDRVALVGDGKLGLLIAQVLRLPGCEVTVVGRHPERWALLHRQGIQTVASTAAEGWYDVVVDVTGNPEGLKTSRKLVRPRGRLVMKSTVAAETQLDLTMLVVDEIQLIGSRCGPFAAALRLLQRNLIETEPLLSGIYAMDDAMTAFTASKGALKVVLDMRMGIEN